MLRNRMFWYVMMAGSLAGWAFVAKGLAKPFENEFVKKVWKQVFAGWVFGHPLELLISLFIGKSAGLSAARTIAKTLLFGFTWWVPLFLKVIRK